MEIEDKRQVLKQEWENYRYQDNLRWSKIQTIGVIEAGLLAGLYSEATSVTLLMKLIFAVITSLLVLTICLLAEKDGRDAMSHMKRARLMEELLDIPPVDKAINVFGVRGHHTMRIAIFLLNSLNVFVIFDLASRMRYAARGAILFLL